MVANFPNADVFYPNNPVGIDAKIKDIQLLLTGATWLEKIFGRATTQRNQVTPPAGSKSREIIYPEVYQANDEPLNAMPNDNFRSYCFFTVNDPAVFVDYNAFDVQQLMRRPISIIFWANQDKIAAGDTGRINENLLLNVIEILKSVPDFKPENVFERYDHVFQEFTITEEYRNYMKLPFTAFRITGDITYAAFSENVCVEP